MYTKPFVLTSLAYFCFFSNVNAYNLLPLYLQRLGGREGEIGTIMAMYSVAAILCPGGSPILSARPLGPSARGSPEHGGLGGAAAMLLPWSTRCTLERCHYASFAHLWSGSSCRM